MDLLKTRYMRLDISIKHCIYATPQHQMNNKSTLSLMDYQPNSMILPLPHGNSFSLESMEDKRPFALSMLSCK